MAHSLGDVRKGFCESPLNFTARARINKRRISALELMRIRIQLTQIIGARLRVDTEHLPLGVEGVAFAVMLNDKVGALRDGSAGGRPPEGAASLGSDVGVGPEVTA